MTRHYRVGEIIKGKITGIQPYGAFVAIDNFYQGLIHISEITDAYVKNVNDFIKLGEEVDVQILSIDEEQGKMSLSLKALREQEQSFSRRHHTSIRIPKTSPDGFKILENKLVEWLEQHSHPNK